MSVRREKLYEQIWAEPIIKVSEQYGVSDSYLVRILKKLNIPRPLKATGQLNLRELKQKN